MSALAVFAAASGAVVGAEPLLTRRLDNQPEPFHLLVIHLLDG